MRHRFSDQLRRAGPAAALVLLLAAAAYGKSRMCWPRSLRSCVLAAGASLRYTTADTRRRQSHSAAVAGGREEPRGAAGAGRVADDDRERLIYLGGAALNASARASAASRRLIGRLHHQLRLQARGAPTAAHLAVTAGPARKPFATTVAPFVPPLDEPFLWHCGDSYGSCSGGYGSCAPYLSNLRRLCAAPALRNYSFLVQLGDALCPCTTPYPVFCKARRVADRCGVLLPLNTARHWQSVRMTRLTYVPWEEKLETVLCWRGATTGHGLRNLRARWVSELAAQGHDVRFSEMVQGVKVSGRASRASLTRRQIMGYKYVLSLEGNDVATNLKWLMAHNSLIFMPVPTKESWLMEGLLRPWVHYVPLDSPADAARRLAWARAHDDECRRIVRAANAWVQRLLEGWEPGREAPALAHRLVLAHGMAVASPAYRRLLAHANKEPKAKEHRALINASRVRALPGPATAVAGQGIPATEDRSGMLI